jgi:hypothetical protein
MLNFSSLGQMALLGWLGLAVGFLPLAAGVLYAIRPDERRLAVMRPLSLAALFASVGNLLLALANALHFAGSQTPAAGRAIVPVTVLVSEALVPCGLGFAFLTAAWLCVAASIRRAA